LEEVSIMKSILNWIYYYHKFFWIFPNCLSIFLGKNTEFRFILFQKFLSHGARRSVALSPSSHSYWPSGVALLDAVGAGINTSSRPAEQRRPPPRLMHPPRQPRSDASPASQVCLSAVPLSERATIAVHTRRRCLKPPSPPVRLPSHLPLRRHTAVSIAAFLPVVAALTDLVSRAGRPNRAHRASKRSLCPPCIGHRVHLIVVRSRDIEQSPELEATEPHRSRCLGSPAREPHRATTSGHPHPLPSHR
jgi:hypothetical protein